MPSEEERLYHGPLHPNMRDDEGAREYRAQFTQDVLNDKGAWELFRAAEMSAPIGKMDNSDGLEESKKAWRAKYDFNLLEQRIMAWSAQQQADALVILTKQKIDNINQQINDVRDKTLTGRMPSSPPELHKFPHTIGNQRSRPLPIGKLSPDRPVVDTEALRKAADAFNNRVQEIEEHDLLSPNRHGVPEMPNHQKRNMPFEQASERLPVLVIVKSEFALMRMREHLTLGDIVTVGVWNDIPDRRYRFVILPDMGFNGWTPKALRQKWNEWRDYVVRLVHKHDPKTEIMVL